MADIGQALEGIITNTSKAIGNLQVSINKILWGKGNAQPKRTASYDNKTGQLVYTTTPTTATPPGKSKLIDSGLFNALDAIARVNLCDILNYLLAHSNIKKPERPADKTTWKPAQKVFYPLQDLAGDIVKQIDKYTAYPNTLLSSFTQPGANGLAVQTAQDILPQDSQKLTGTQVTKYNTFYLVQSIKDTLNAASPKNGSIFSSEDRALLAQVPGLNSKLNLIDDFVAKMNQYTDYRNISNTDIEKIQSKLATIRTICVAIQSVDIARGTVAVGNFLQVDIRGQIQELSKFLDPTKLIPTLKSINTSIQAFVRIAQRIQQFLKTAQFLIKILILFTKIFIFIKKFLTKLPLPNLYTTSGVQSTLSSLAEDAKAQADSATKTLKEVNALLQVIIDFIRYIVANTNDLAIRLQTILTALQDCEAVKDSDVIAQLTASLQTLNTVQEQLTAYLVVYDINNTDPNNAKFGKYDIRVVDEEVTDTSIVNKRRRGIALDINGSIVAQSDLTFATDTRIIIEEVKLKLITLGLVQSTLGPLTGEQASIIAESINYLDNNDITIDDLTVPETELDAPDNENEDSGLGLNAFLNKLKGGRRMRRRTRRALAKAAAKLKAQLAGEGVAAKNSIGSTILNKTVGPGQATKNYQVRVYIREPNQPSYLGLGLLYKTVTVQATTEDQAKQEAQDMVDPNGSHTNTSLPGYYYYKATQVQ